MDILFTIVLLVPALLLAAPLLVDLGAWVAGRDGPGDRPPPDADAPPPPILFLVPAHDEEPLLERTVDSLLGQDYPEERREVVVIADHCSDRTAALARRRGATVLERDGSGEPGKHHAIGWALERLDLDGWAAVAIVDADTEVEQRFARRIATHAPLEEIAVQARVGASNDDENWLTCLAAVLNRSRWDLELPARARAGLNCPLTGDGTVIGTELLRRHPWRITTVTEGWELYARLTLAGVPCRYERGARLYAQEARSLEQSKSQRERWTAGRLAVLRMNLRRILTTPGIRALQRLDLVVELGSVGPVMEAFFGIAGATAALATGTTAGGVVAVLFVTPLIRTGVYAAVAATQHPQPRAVVRAVARLPFYVGWRVMVGLRTLALPGTERWVRTERHDEFGAARDREPSGD